MLKTNRQQQTMITLISRRARPILYPPYTFGLGVGFLSSVLSLALVCFCLDFSFFLFNSNVTADIHRILGQTE